MPSHATLSAVLTKNAVVVVSWSVAGGCPPVSGTLTAQQQTGAAGIPGPTRTYDVTTTSGSITDHPSCCDVRYSLRMVDSARREVVFPPQTVIWFQ